MTTAAATIKTIPPQELEQLLKSGGPVDLIDVRMPTEYRQIHVQNARCIPLDSLDPRQVMRTRHLPAEAPLYIICHSGMRATKACEQFLAAGYHNVVCVEGGTSACEKAGLPVVRGKKAVSLERQVRTIAGFLVLLGLALGVWLSPWGLLLSAFVGAGLVFAGITDRCGMAMMLAKLPWNRCDTGCCGKH
jgi:rhodanese-related sulfurtransferase